METGRILAIAAAAVITPLVMWIWYRLGVFDGSKKSEEQNGERKDVTAWKW